MELLLQFLIVASSGIAINGHNNYNKDGKEATTYNPLGALVRLVKCEFDGIC